MSRIVVAVATLGRPDDVADLLEALSEQTRQPDHIVLSVTDPQSDLPDPEIYQDADVLIGSKGLCAQRNRVLEHIKAQYDFLVFFDDDYIPSKTTIEDIVSFFEAHPDVVGMSGRLLADGILGPGLSKLEATDLVKTYDASPPSETNQQKPVTDLYGCNMAYRVSAIGTTRFDERLPAYGWLEDVDFSNQLLARGKLIKTDAFVGVHRGTKRARSRGKPLGYSQIANPIYLAGKGTMSNSRALTQLSRNLIANHVKSLRPEPWVDRWGRVGGNWLAIIDLLRGRLDPERIVHL